MLIYLKKITKVSPLSNFLKIPEAVIDRMDIYSNRWFIFAKYFCPKKRLVVIFGGGLIILFKSLKIVK